jgi:uncharacterized repeat protein (TIGR04076 family)
MSDFSIEQAREAGQDFKEALGMSDEEFEEYISFGFNRRLMQRAEEMGQARIVAEVTEAKYCLAGCQVGQKLVLQCVPAMLLPEESDCPLCSKAIGPVAELVHQLWDRMSEGLDPNEGQAQFASCLDHGIAFGGLGNVRFRVYVEKRPQ